MEGAGGREELEVGGGRVEPVRLAGEERVPAVERDDEEGRAAVAERGVREVPGDLPGEPGDLLPGPCPPSGGAPPGRERQGEAGGGPERAPEGRSGKRKPACAGFRIDVA